MKASNKATQRKRRHYRVRSKIAGTSERPRLSVFKSNKHLYVQVIDDESETTLAAASTLSPELKGQALTRETAAKLGTLAAEAAKSKGITSVVFDRGGFSYEGKIKELADAAREAGLQF